MEVQPYYAPKRMDACASLVDSLLRGTPDLRILATSREAHSEQTGVQRSSADEAFIRPLITKAREALGEPAFAAAEREGRALSYEEAIAEARAWLESRS